MRQLYNIIVGGNDVDSQKRITYSDLVKQTCQVKITMQ